MKGFAFFILARGALHDSKAKGGADTWTSQAAAEVIQRCFGKVALGGLE
ncbi:hypothetical protein [Roseomonas elaeocarpi]|uniref:Uncharacterized protein n=1 Tax=Roseomonas elaeocarpi TaxID=907779 RepID=A0ABV6JMZ9_9PROT